jgi:glycosyltransferase involved in cell wall biosynthesis
LSRRGTAVIYDAHELWADRNLRPEPRWWLLACEWLFLRTAHVTLATSPGHAEEIARRYRVPPPRVIRNIPVRAPAGPGAGRGQRGDANAVVYVGALTRNRGLEVAISALAWVPEARLRLVGPARDGYEAELTELARRLGVLDRVEFAGAVAPAEVAGAIGGASVGLALIQPSCLSYELSLPNKLFEYALAGVPVLGSDLPVIGEYVRERGLGLVARADDVADVAAKLSEMLEPDRNAALREAVGAAAEELDWERESALLREAYKDALARAGGAPAREDAAL